MSITKTLTRADISEAITIEVGLTRHEAARLTDSIIDEVSQALVDTGLSKISSFGRFCVRKKNERVGRNPKTGKEVPISPRLVLTFRASQTLKDRVDAGHAKKTGSSSV